MGWSVWLLAMVRPLLARVLVALGFSVVTITGLAVSVGTIKGLVLQHLGEFPAAGLQLALLAGCGEAIGIIFGAVTTRLVLWQIQQGTKLLGVNS